MHPAHPGALDTSRIPGPQDIASLTDDVTGSPNEWIKPMARGVKGRWLSRALDVYLRPS